MNDRIKELIKLSTTVEHGVIQPRKITTVMHFDKEKFAELLIKECGQFTKQIIAAGGIPADHANAMLLAHFGIEE